MKKGTTWRYDTLHHAFISFNYVLFANLFCSTPTVRIRDYDNVRRFLTPSIPLRETHLEMGIDLKMKQRQDSDLSCFIRHVAYRYAHNLGMYV